MKHTVQEEDGSYTTYDETEDGIGLVWLSQFISWLKGKDKKWVCKACGREYPYRDKDKADNCCFMCEKCGKYIHGYDACLLHEKSCDEKKQISSNIDSAKELLKKQFVKGKITEKEYNKKLKVIK